MKDKEKEFIERVKCGILCCEDIPFEIEKMASVMCSSYNKPNSINCKTCPTNWCYAEECATMAYCNGYRNVKDMVVLSKEEYESMQKLFTYDKPMLDRISTFIQETKDQTRQETAREIYEQLCGHGTTYVKKWIKEQFGVEIKE